MLLNGVAVDPGLVSYAGATPDCAGLYQINVRLPEDAPANPEVRIGTGGPSGTPEPARTFSVGSVKHSLPGPRFSPAAPDDFESFLEELG